MDFKQLRAFTTVAETGNVTRAAEVLHLVQPAVSRQLRLLEEDIGAPLFDRERHGMALTPAGKALLEYARRAMLELDRARVEIAGAASGVVSGLATLGLLPSTIDLLSSPLVSTVALQFPAVRMRIAMGYAGTLRRWLVSGEVDAALLYGTERSAEVQTTPLVEEPLWVVGPRDAGICQSQPVPLAQLAGKPMVLPSVPHGIRALVDHACAIGKITLQIAVETNALSVQRALVMGGHGLTILPPIAVAEELRNGQLCGAPLIDPPLTRTIVFATPANRPIGLHVQRTVELLGQLTREAVASGAWPQGVWLGT